ncbi:hypothetical protein LXT21_19520 [Myxococcus sp. K38C18041901]|uniref:hypothetical protein n=1 Tax=Myxococcus guangdongensis TaxID=2906760 RepID=UPI0020A7373B|nr:hypothetical protein [Myxococcus guangdongensis]MCP3060978.1 hypothetical protein [Myxococcus guangdongensis]
MLRPSLVLTAFLLAAPALAAASPGVPDPSRIEEFARLVFDAVTSRNWALAASLAVVAVVYALRRFGGSLFPWLKSARAGAVLAVLVAVAGAVSNALVAGESFTWGLLLKALGIGLGAAGGFSVLKALLFGDEVTRKAEVAGDLAVGEIAGKAAAVAVLEQLQKGRKP